MYLSPKYHDLAINKNFSHDYLNPEIVKLAMNWKLKKVECIQLAQDIHNSFIFTKDHKTMTPIYFWKTTQQFTEPTRKLASLVFQTEGTRSPCGDFVVKFWGLPPLIPLLQYVNRLGFEICSVNRMNNRTRKLGYVNLNWPRCSARVTESLALTDGSFCQKQNTLYFRLCKNCEFMMCILIVDH